MKILKFYSDTCGPCKVLTKNLEDANIEVEPILPDSDLVDTYNIRSIPTLVMVDDEGKEYKRFTGIMSTEQLKNWVNE